MTPEIEEYYQQIAELIAEAIDDDWAKARIDIIFFPGVITSFGEYTTSSGSLKDFATSWNIQRTFMELRAKFKEENAQLWGQATFDLTSEGKFSMTWGYENCDENGDTIFDEDREHQREESRRLRLNAAD
jgi:hypothetical protein